jgi:predicted DNA-binding ribbon-helix-helix protein
MPHTGNQKHSVSVRGHRTSITLEPEFWESLQEIAAASATSLNTLIAQIDADDPKNLSGALRVFVLNYYKQRAK